MSQFPHWNPDKYQHNAHFVSELGMPVVDLLDPKPTESILDLGCGNGTLMEKLRDLGCQVTGVDSSPDMVKVAQSKGLSAQVMNGENLTFNQQFDAVFSNAALHWMKKQNLVLQGVYQALKPGGRFVAELGGAGNVATIVQGIMIAGQKRNWEIKEINPWFFPSAEDYKKLLESEGFVVKSIDIFPRPTVLPQGMKGWLEMFAQQFTEVLPLEDRSTFIEEVVNICQPQLCNQQGEWIADYVRLRFSAWKSIE